MKGENVSRRFVRLECELFNGTTLWSSVDHYTLDGRPHFGEEATCQVGMVHKEAADSDYGYFMRESGEHGFLWMPLDDNTEWIALGEVLGFLRVHKDGCDPYIQFGLEYFLNGPGIFPICGVAIRDILPHRICVGHKQTREQAIERLKTHQKPYEKAKVRR